MQRAYSRFVLILKVCQTRKTEIENWSLDFLRAVKTRFVTYTDTQPPRKLRQPAENYVKYYDSDGTVLSGVNE